MEAESDLRKWAGWLLGAAVALQFYFVWELLAALALFAIGFAAVASVMVGLYGLQKGWEKAVTYVHGIFLQSVINPNRFKSSDGP